VAGGKIHIGVSFEELTGIKEKPLFMGTLSGISVYKHVRNECWWALLGQHLV